MLEGGGVGVEGGGFEAELSAGLSPAGHGGKDFAEDRFCRGGFEAEARRSGQRSGDGGSSCSSVIGVVGVCVRSISGTGLRS